MIFPPEIVGWLGTAVENDPEGRCAFPQVLEKLLHFVRTRSGKGASGEEDRIAVAGKPIVREAARGSPPLVVEDYTVLGIVSPSPSNRIPPHMKKHFVRLEIDRANRGAESAEAAFEGRRLMLFVERIVGFRNGFGIAVFLKEPAFLDAGITFDTLARNGAEPSHEPCSTEEVSITT
jgi:hypothetical protein